MVIQNLVLNMGCLFGTVPWYIYIYETVYIFLQSRPLPGSELCSTYSYPCRYSDRPELVEVATSGRPQQLSESVHHGADGETSAVCACL